MTVNYQNSQVKQFLKEKLHAKSIAMFFTQNGILLNLPTQRYLLPVKETFQQLKGMIESVHLVDNLFLIKCTLDLAVNKLLDQGFATLSIKSLLTKLNPGHQHLLLKAYHWIQWDEQSCFCGKCGQPLPIQFLTPAKQCTYCQQIFFPRFSPAVLVLIQKNDKILLARSPHFTPGVYSVIAGFVDIGETAEMTVHREVTEEIGIKVGKLQYFRSQTWPFPDSFMIAFKSTYVRGKISINTDELEDARWFDIHNLPKLPKKASISRKLIDSVIQKK